MVILILFGVLLPAAGFFAYRLSRRQATRTRQSKTARVTLRTDDRRLGYRYADDRIFINGGGVFTGLRLPATTDEFSTSSEAGDIALQPVAIYRDLLGLFGGKPVECHELVRYRPITTGGWLAQLLNHAWDPTDLYRILAAKLADHIAASTPERLWVLIVRLGDFPTPTGSPVAAAEAGILGVAEERFTHADLAPWRARAEHLHEVVRARGAEPMTRRDLLWLIRKPGYGHLPMPDQPPTRRRPWRRGFFELAATIRGSNPGGGHVELHKTDPHTGRKLTSYTTTLVVADEPPRQVFSARAAWARRLERLETPAEISWRYTLVPAADWKRLATRAVDNIEDERRDREKAGAEPDMRFEGRLDQADQLRSDVADDPQPGMIGRLRLSVSAATPEALARAVLAVQTAMGDIQMEAPEYAQLPLLAEQLPGEANQANLGSLSAGPAGGLRLWARHSDTYLPALAMLSSHQQVGDRIEVARGRELGWIGIPVGYVQSNGSVVHLDPQAQLARNHGAGVAIHGASGSGKSSLAMTLFFWMSESGVRCSVLDPKIEFASFVYYIAFGPQVLHPDFWADADRGMLGTPHSQFQPVNRRFWDDTEIIDLANGARGSQDPWRTTATFGEGYELATTLTDLLFADPEARRIVKKALRELDAAVKAAPADQTLRAGFGDVVPLLAAERAELDRDIDLARDRGGDTRALRTDRDLYDEVLDRFTQGTETPVLRLLLGRGDDPTPTDHGGHKRRTIYTLAGFQPPEHPDDPTAWSDTDRNAAAAMLSVLRRVRRDNLSGRLVPNPVTGAMGIAPTAAIVDEANMMTADAAGRRYMMVNLRQGRTLGANLIFISQQARDSRRIELEAEKTDATETNQFGCVAIFRQKSLPEGRSALEMLRSTTGDVPKAEIDKLARKTLSPAEGGQLNAGECILRDPDSRVSAATIDMGFLVLQRAGQTNPQLKPVDWAHPVPTDPADWEINPETLMRVRTQVAAADDAFGVDPGDDDPLDDNEGRAA